MIFFRSKYWIFNSHRILLLCNTLSAHFLFKIIFEVHNGVCSLMNRFDWQTPINFTDAHLHYKTKNEEAQDNEIIELVTILGQHIV